MYDHLRVCTCIYDQLCMSTCMYMYVRPSTCMYMYLRPVVHVYVYVHVSATRCACLRVCTCIYDQMCMSTCMTCMYDHLRVCTCNYDQMCMSTCMYMYLRPDVHVYTYVHVRQSTRQIRGTSTCVPKTRVCMNKYMNGSLPDNTNLMAPASTRNCMYACMIMHSCKCMCMQMNLSMHACLFMCITHGLHPKRQKFS
jgi:hypothetical protein